MPFIDFAALKKEVSFQTALSVLDLDAHPEGKNAMGNKTWRANCPACDKDRVLFVTEREAYFCHAEGKGGDVIALAAHVLGLRMRDAALELSSRVSPGTGTSNSKSTSRQGTSRTVPESERRKATQSRGEAPKASPHPFDPAEFWAKTAYTEEVAALGITEEAAEELGIGFYRGKLYQALRYANGEIAGYSSFANGEMKVPANLLPMGNVVRLPKRA